MLWVREKTGHSSGAKLLAWKTTVTATMLLLRVPRVVLSFASTMATGGCWLPGEVTEALGEAT